MISKDQIVALLLGATSASVSEVLGKEAMKSEKTFYLLKELVAEGIQPQAWKAAWALDKGTEEHPEKIDIILPWIYDFLMVEDHDGSVRHLMKILLRRPLIEDKAGLLLDKAVYWVNNEKASVSKRVYGIELMFRVYELYPDFKSELLSIIDDNLEKGGQAGFLNRLGKIKAKL